jgi:hypothetical protein
MSVPSSSRWVAKLVAEGVEGDWLADAGNADNVLSTVDVAAFSRMTSLILSPQP